MKNERFGVSWYHKSVHSHNSRSDPTPLISAIIWYVSYYLLFLFKIWTNLFCWFMNSERDANNWSQFMSWNWWLNQIFVVEIAILIKFWPWWLWRLEMVLLEICIVFSAWKIKNLKNMEWIVDNFTICFSSNHHMMKYDLKNRNHVTLIKCVMTAFRDLISLFGSFNFIRCYYCLDAFHVYFPCLCFPFVCVSILLKPPFNQCREPCFRKLEVLSNKY